MPDVYQSKNVLRFGVFELNPESGELRKSGLKVKLQEQPFQVLALLVERPGEIVTREEFCKKLWPDGTFVEFDRSLNIAINKIRDALGDSAAGPRFVETVPRRGYRFIAPVEKVGPAAPVGVPPPEPKLRRRWARASSIVALAVVMALGGVLWHAGRKPRAADPLRVTPLTIYPGAELYPTFSPEGNDIAFAWNGEKPDNFDIYRLLIGAAEPLRLTRNPAPDFSPAWSPDGRLIAFVRRIAPDRLGVFLIPGTGGTERELAELYYDQPIIVAPGWYWANLAWSRDSQWLITSGQTAPEEPFGLAAVSVKTGEIRRLTAPHGRDVLDVGPGISPDGQELAFLQGVAGTEKFGLYTLTLSGAMVPLGSPKPVPLRVRPRSSPVWTPGTRELVFAADSSGALGLWGAAVTGAPERLIMGGAGGLPAISSQGRRLAFANLASDFDIWRTETLDQPGSSPSATPLIDTTRAEYHPAFSPDGHRIAFQSDRSGVSEIWLSNSDGSGLVQVTSFGQPYSGSPQFSPDGTEIAFDSSIDGQWDVWVIDAHGRKPRRLTSHQDSDTRPHWSGEGNWIYFCSNRTGASQVWKIPASRGDAGAIQVTKNGGGPAIESPDGTHLYYLRVPGGGSFAGSASDPELCRVPIGGGPEVKIADSVRHSAFAVTKKGVWYVRKPEAQERGLTIGEKHFAVWLYSFTTGDSRLVAVVPGQSPLAGIAVSPDSRWLLYSPARIQADLMLVENFR